jgi:tetratricopeptide (TPR) repeat protein
VHGTAEESKKSSAPVPPSHRHVQAGFARLRQNRFAEAVQSFQRALTLAQGTNELDGEDLARIEHLIGQCLRELRNISGARVHLERAWAQVEAFYGADDVAVIPICMDLADVLRSLGAEADAKALYERALAVDPTASTVVATLCGLGKVLEHMRDLSAATAHYRKALALAETHDGRDSEARVLTAVHLGRALQLLGDMEEGKVYLQRAMALGSIAFRHEFAEAAATMSRLEMALDGGAVISRAVH